VSEAELIGVLCAWDRIEAHAAARKLTVVAKLARRNPAPLDAEFTADQLAYALGESRGRAEILLDLAHTLPTRLPVQDRRGAPGRDDFAVQGRDHRRRHRVAG
jgi:hypothetical protein